MGHKKICFLLFVITFVISVVKGSCLEYGHSCWGAHGKRSGLNANKIPNTNTLLRAAASAVDNNALNEDIAPYFENFDDLTVHIENSETAGSSEEQNTKQSNRNRSKQQRAALASWRKLPVFNLRSNFAKALLKQLERKAIAAKENNYYELN